MKDRSFKYLFIAPAFLLVSATVLYPLLYAIWTSFHEWRLSKSRVPTDFVWFGNYYRAFFDDPAFWQSVFTTGTFIVGSVLSATLVALLIALLLSRQGKIYTITRTIIVLPFAMSPALQGTSFRFFLNQEFGIFDHLIGFVFPFAAEIDWLGDSTWAMIWLILTDTWHWAPFLSLMLIGGLLSIPRDTIEAASVDGASAWTRFWTVILPQLLPVLAIACVLKTIFSFKMFEYVYLLTGGGPGSSTATLTYYAYRQGFHAYDMGYASAIAFVLAVLLIGVSVVYFRLLFPKEREA